MLEPSRMKKGMRRKLDKLPDNNPQNGLPPARHLFSLGTIFLVVFLVASTFLALAQHNKETTTHAATSFSFTVAGDYAQTNYTTANLNYIASSGVSFNLAIGDLNYDPTTTTADAWSSYVKSHLHANFPFEILAGNEDVSQLDALAADLPDHLGTISGTYAKEYYFDYPLNTPLARFILISPSGVVSGYNYGKGSSHYKWVAKTIDSARTAGIRWVIVAMHEPCISISNLQGKPSCSSGSALQDLLVSKKVDLVLEGHVHNYQASKQLAFNGTTCTTIQVNGYNNDCVANATTSLTEGAGTVFVITGTGGKTPLATLNTADPETGYFRASMGANVSPSWGLSQFSISATQLTEHFVPVSGGTFQDSFTITATNASPTPSVTPSTTPSVTPSPGTTLAQDDFNRPDQSLWGKNTDGQSWAGDANSKQVFSITNHMGQVAANSTNNFSAVLGPTVANAEVIFTGMLSIFSSANMGAVLRWTDNNDWYKAYIDGSNLELQKKVNGTLTKLKTMAFTARGGTSYTLAFGISGSMLSASVWLASDQQPSSWMISATDTSFSTGNCGLHVSLSSGITADFTSFQALQQ